MEARTTRVLTVEKLAVCKLLSSLREWQMEALFNAGTAQNEDEMKIAVENMGICQGILNSLCSLELITKEEHEDAVKKQQDIAEAIKKSALRLADR